MKIALGFVLSDAEIDNIKHKPLMQVYLNLLQGLINCRLDKS